VKFNKGPFVEVASKREIAQGSLCKEKHELNKGANSFSQIPLQECSDVEWLLGKGERKARMEE